MIRIIMQEGTAGTLRAALLLLVALGVVGTALALAYERHWDGTWQLVPWATLGGVSIALAVLLVRTTRATVWFARVLAVLVILAAVLGFSGGTSTRTTIRRYWTPVTVNAGIRCRLARACGRLRRVRLAMYPYPPLGHWCPSAWRWRRRLLVLEDHRGRPLGRTDGNIEPL